MKKINIRYRESNLNGSITIDNFESQEAVLIVNFNEALVKDALGIPLENSLDELFLNREITIDTNKKDLYNKYGSGHWIDKAFYNKLKIIVNENNLEHELNSTCLILLIFKYYLHIFSSPLPKRPEPTDLEKFESLINQLKDNYRGIQIKFSMPGKDGILATLSEDFFKYSRDWFVAYQKSTEGYIMLSFQKAMGGIDNRFFDKLDKLGIDNRSRTIDSLKRMLIQRLYKMLEVRIRGKRRRLILIGKLMASIGVYSENDHPDEYSNMDAYYYDLLRRYVKE